MSEDQQSVEADTVLGKFKISSGNLNTLFTIMCFILTCIIAWALWTHGGEARESSKEVALQLKETNKETAVVLKEFNKDLTQILKELAQATREQSCLLSIPPEKRIENSEICKRISR